MRRLLSFRSFVLSCSLLLITAFATPQELPCNEVTAIAGMANSRTLATLKHWSKKAGQSYQARFVYVVRSFELSPHSRSAAVTLLASLPPISEQETAWYSLTGFLCSDETMAQLSTLSRLQDRLPRAFAKAVIVAPEKMDDYVAYASTAIGDPHNDYAVQMQPVCRKQHTAFVRALEKLSANDQKWFTSRIFKPATCRAIALPEAE